MELRLGAFPAKAAEGLVRPVQDSVSRRNTISAGTPPKRQQAPTRNSASDSSPTSFRHLPGFAPSAFAGISHGLAESAVGGKRPVLQQLHALTTGSPPLRTRHRAQAIARPSRLCGKRSGDPPHECSAPLPGRAVARPPGRRLCAIAIAPRLCGEVFLRAIFLSDH